MNMKDAVTLVSVVVVVLHQQTSFPRNNNSFPLQSTNAKKLFEDAGTSSIESHGLRFAGTITSKNTNTALPAFLQ